MMKSLFLKMVWMNINRVIFVLCQQIMNKFMNFVLYLTASYIFYRFYLLFPKFVYVFINRRPWVYRFFYLFQVLLHIFFIFYLVFLFSYLLLSIIKLFIFFRCILRFWQFNFWILKWVVLNSIKIFCFIFS